MNCIVTEVWQESIHFTDVVQQPKERHSTLQFKKVYPKKNEIIIPKNTREARQSIYADEWKEAERIEMESKEYFLLLKK